MDMQPVILFLLRDLIKGKDLGPGDEDIQWQILVVREVACLSRLTRIEIIAQKPYYLNHSLTH